jgi:hypothetical protein
MVLPGCGSRSALLDGLADGAAAIYPWEPRAVGAAGPLDAEGPASSGAPGARVRLPRSCAENWVTLYETDAAITGTLAVRDGEVIFGVGVTAASPPEVRALDVGGSGRVRVIRRGSTYDALWLEGDDLLLWTRDRLQRVPLEGGSEQLLVDLRGSDPSSRIETLLVQTDAIYWTPAGDESTPLEVWRQTRSSEPPALVASLERGSLYPRGLAATAEIVIVAGGSSALALPLRGADPQPLDVVSDGSFVGVDDLGAYHERTANRTRRGGDALEFEIRRAPADGSPNARLWRGSAGQRLGSLWPLESGWLAIGQYYLFDRTPHAVIAHLDEGGHATLVACDRGRNVLLGRPVFGDGAFYAVTRAGNLWRVVEIRLPDE